MQRSLGRLGEHAAGVVGGGMKYARMALTIARSGIVPVGLHRGAPILPALLRHGTTIAGLYAGAAAAVGDRPAIVDDHGMLTFAELDHRAAALAAALSAELDVTAGSTVGLLARNHAGFVEALLACGRIGAHVILLNTGMSPAQAAVVAEQQGIEVLIVDADLVDRLDEVDADVPRVLCGTGPDGHDGWTTPALVAAGVGRPEPPKPAEHGRTVVMTSGTTGAPKGAQRPSSGGPAALAAILSRIPVRADESTLVLPPLFHTWGLANLQIAAAMRSTVVLRRRFEPAQALADLSAHGCTVMAAVPVMLQRILELAPEERPERDLVHLRIVASSGSALPGPLATKWMEAFGPTLYNLYGSTEVSWATIATPEDLRAAPGTAGKPPLGTALRVLDDEGRPVPAGEVGRIFVGNDLLFEGYTGGVAGKESIDGLMATGDVGSLDAEGRLYVSGRDDDMIVSGGENVFPKEVEDLLAHRDDIIEAAVIGVDDEEFGQRLAAFVVPADPDSPPDPDELRAHVKANLANFSVPRDVTFLDELPRNPTGKVVARDLPGQGDSEDR